MTPPPGIPLVVPRTPAARAAALVLVALTYYASARLGLGLSLVGHNVTPLWPPTGVAVAALLVLGRRMWPAVAVAAFAVNVPISATLLAAAVTAVGNTLAPYLAVVLLHRVGFRRDLDRQRDALAIVFVGALAAMLVSATIGAGTLVAAGTITTAELPTAWAVWWTGDAMGVLVVAPFLLGLPLSWELEPVAAATVARGGRRSSSRRPPSSAGRCRAGCRSSSSCCPSSAGRRGGSSCEGPPRRHSSPALVATWAAVRDLGPFAGISVLEQMVTLQAFNVCVALTSFVLAALVSESDRQARGSRTPPPSSSERVEQRTAPALHRQRPARPGDPASDRRPQEQLSREEAAAHREHEIAETLQRSLLPDRIADVPGGRPRRALRARDGRPAGRRRLVRRRPAARRPHRARHRRRRRPRPARRRDDGAGAHGAAGLRPPGPLAGLRHVRRAPARRRSCAVPEMVTLIYLVLDPSTRQPALQQRRPPSGARRPRRRGTYLTGGLAPPLGVTSEAIFTEATHELAPGATLLLYTDGLVERRGVPITDGLDPPRRRGGLLGRGHTGARTSRRCATTCSRRCSTRTRVADDVALVALRPTVSADGSLALRLPGRGSHARAGARCRAPLVA